VGSFCHRACRDADTDYAGHPNRCKSGRSRRADPVSQGLRKADCIRILCRTILYSIRATYCLLSVRCSGGCFCRCAGIYTYRFALETKPCFRLFVYHTNQINAQRTDFFGGVHKTVKTSLCVFIGRFFTKYTVFVKGFLCRGMALVHYKNTVHTYTQRCIKVCPCVRSKNWKFCRIG